MNRSPFLPAALASMGFSGPVLAQGESAVPIQYHLVATEPLQNVIGHVKTIGDCNGDGFPDIIITASTRGVGWYEYPGWSHHEMTAVSFGWRGDDVEAVDIDGDGDTDVIGSNTESGNVYVLENPLPGGDPNGHWPQHLVGSNGDYLKDVEVADFDGDGKLDVVTRTSTTVSIFLQSSIGSWNHVRKLSNLHDNEGMDVGDLDADGDPDVVLNGFWLRTPSNLSTGSFAQHTIDSKWYDQSGNGWRDNNAKVAVADVDDDGKLDVLFSQSEMPGFPVSWYEANDPGGTWTEHVIGQVDHAHTLQPADVDLDGDIDVFAGQMVDGGAPYPVYLFLNEGGGLLWSDQLLTSTGMYSGVIGDIGSDGDVDLVGVRSIELDEPKHLELFENCGNACSCDVTADGVVGVPDYLALVDNFGASGGDATDCTGDTVTGVPDYLALVSGFGMFSLPQLPLLDASTSSLDPEATPTRKGGRRR